MSEASQDAFWAALRAYDRAAAEAIATGQQVSAPELAESSGLPAAAQAHVEASRPLDVLLAEYAAANSALHENPAPAASDMDAHEALGAELTGVRMATAILGGSYPGTAPAVTAEAGA
jgi:hypothetical protein